MPPIPDNVLSSPSRLGELQREPLDPPVHRHVVDLDAALGEELSDVPVRKTEPQGPAHRQRDHFRRESVPEKTELGAMFGRGRGCAGHGRSLPDADPGEQCNSADGADGGPDVGHQRELERARAEDLLRLEVDAECIGETPVRPVAEGECVQHGRDHPPQA